MKLRAALAALIMAIVALGPSLASAGATAAIPFTDTNAVATRSFNSFSEAGLEAANSRIYGGIHYEFSDLPAVGTGHVIGDFIMDNVAAVPEPSCGILVLAGAGLVGVRRRRAR